MVSMHVEGAALQALMTARGVKASQLARAAGISAEVIRSATSGRRHTMRDTSADAIAKALRVPRAAFAHPIVHPPSCKIRMVSQ